ncbi:hypothetical protein [Streptomyces cyanogenus]|uniref:hypothetical protein n=1 Tax=Streptomyces cyanogenus TaxID=80860 RepID=UPI001FB5C063|nr:hypothetical protein [Streptomyces cyanogenus]
MDEVRPQFAQHLERDLDAVIAGLTQPWNSGVVEGHANRIKLLKRQMFGRAGFELLRKRVLLADRASRLRNEWARARKEESFVDGFGSPLGWSRHDQCR